MRSAYSTLIIPVQSLAIVPCHRPLPSSLAIVAPFLDCHRLSLLLYICSLVGRDRVELILRYWYLILNTRQAVCKGYKQYSYLLISAISSCSTDDFMLLSIACRYRRIANMHDMCCRDIKLLLLLLLLPLLLLGSYNSDYYCVLLCPTLLRLF